MRPVLVALPSKLLFAVALLLAVVTFVRDRRRRQLASRAGTKLRPSSSPLYFLGAAWLILGLRGGGFVPSGAALSRPWAPLPIYAYGVMLGTSMVVGWFLSMRLARQDGVRQEDAAAIFLWSAVWSIIGARLLYVVVQRDHFDGVFEMFLLQKGGLVAYGGMIGGFLASWWGCHRRGIPLLQWADVAAPAVVLGTGITRFGCLMFGCDFGRRTQVPWAIQFPQDSPAWDKHVQSFHLPADAVASFPVHPTQLYEAAAGFALFGLLMLLRRKRTFSGQVFLAWVLGYGLLRPLIEVFRDDDQRGNVGPLSTSQAIGLLSVALGCGLLIALVRRHRADPRALRYWERATAGATGFAPGAATAAETVRRGG